MLQGHPPDDVEPVTLEPPVLRRVVRHEAHPRHPELHEDLGADTVLATVDGEPELDVRVDGVPPVVLEVVGAQLVGEADAPPLVAAEVDDHSHAFLADPAYRGFELRAAVAAERAEHVAGQALAVHPDEHAVLGVHVSCDECEVLLAIEQRPEAVGGELAVLGRDARLCDPFHELLAVVPVPDEIRDRDDGKAMVGCELLQLGSARHSLLVVGHDLA